MVRSSSDEGSAGRAQRLEATRRKVLGWNKFVDLVVGGINPTAALVWAVLYRHAVEGVVTRANSQVAKDVGVSRATIKRAITMLRQAKLLRVVRQGGMHAGPTTYRLAVRDLRSSAAGGSEEQKSAGGAVGEAADATSPDLGGAGDAEPQAEAGTVTDASMPRDVDLPTKLSTTTATG